MIVVDRALSLAEESECRNQRLVDLREGVSISHKYRDMLLEWLDSSNSELSDGRTYASLFQVSGVSYWYHIRARLYYRLARHAQFLDRVKQDIRFDEIVRVYCTGHDEEFWRFWAPDATVVVSKPLSNGPRLQKGWSRYVLWAAIRFGRHAWQEVRKGCRVLCMSSGGYTQLRDGKLWDQHLGPILDKSTNWLRLEFVQLPPKGIKQDLKQRARMERSHRSVQTDVLLVSNLVQKPWLLVQLLWHVIRLRSRFRDLPEHPFQFPEMYERWQRLMKESIERFSFSVALFHQYRRVFERIVRLSQAKALYVVSENNSVGRILVGAGRRLSVPTFGMQHGSIDPHNADYRLPKQEKLPLRPDVMFVWGDATREYLVTDCGYSPETTILTGRLFSDTVGTPDPDEQIEALRRKTGKSILLFTSQPPGVFDAYRIRAAEDLARFCRENDLACMIRLHPREVNDGLYDRVFSDENWSENYMYGSGDLYPMIASSDFGATCYSTTGIEVMWMRKPLIVFDPFEQNLLGLRGNPFIYFVGATSGSFQDWLTKKDHFVEAGGKLAENRLGPRSPSAADRILQEIEDYIGDRE